MRKIKFTFTIKFTLIVLSIIIFNAAILSGIFFYNLYSMSDMLARTNVEKSIENLRDNITHLLDRYADMLDNASFGISAMFDQGLDNVQDLSDYFDELINKMPDVDLLYFSSNVKWNSSGGYWVASPSWIPDEDWDQTSRPWFINAKEARGATAFSDPFVDANTGGIIISISRVVYDGQGRDIGVVAADMLVTKLNAEITSTMVFYEQRIHLLNSEGLYITNLLSNKVMTNNFFTENHFEHYYYDVISNYSFHIRDANYDFFSVKILRAGWYLVSMTPNYVIFAEPNQIRRNMILLCLIISAAGVFCSAAFTYFMLNRPFINMLKIFEHLDNNNLSVKFDTVSGGEMSGLINALNNFLYKLNITFLSFKNNANMVSSSIHELSSSAQEISTTANEQSASVSEIVATMENNKDLSARAAEKTTEVAGMAKQTQELSRRGADLHRVNEDMMLDIRDQNAKIIEIIKNLADMLSRIDESIMLIDTIADHTKLIAFNAALEASSSGEAGTRFSVVASEIRRFADNVVESASEIKEKISELQEASQTLISEANNGTQAIFAGYDRMVEQKEVFENIVEVSKNVAVNTQEISSLSKQQELASAQVFSALKEISSGVGQFVSATGMASAAVEKLNKMSSDLKENLAKYNISGKQEENKHNDDKK